MISETLSKLLLLWVATLMGLNSYSQKALANSVITQELLQHYVQALSTACREDVQAPSGAKNRLI